VCLARLHADVLRWRRVLRVPDRLCRVARRLRRAPGSGARDLPRALAPGRTMTPLFGTTLPVIQAPMAGVQGSALAIAVSNAGGLGSLPSALVSIETLRAELAALRAG